ncbi:MAG: hypothetical protein H6Q84_2847 [Deltaproteobacteria bacterium]|nr:hypothetical protein [Deltaproteobacteria bacterium]
MEEKGKRELTDTQASTETTATGDPNTAEGRRGPSWRGWVLSILVAVILSVTATLLLGGSFSFRSDDAAAGAGGRGSGAGRSCCPPADAGK